MTNIECIKLILNVLSQIVDIDDLWNIYLYAKEKLD